MKKIISALLAVLILSASVGVYATSTPTVYTEGYLKYTLSETGSITIVGCFGDQTELTVPSSIAGYPVNTIASGAFADSSVTTVTLPDTIMTVEEGAFSSAQSVVYTTSDPVYVAQNTSTSVKYTTLSEALTAAESGQTVELLTDLDNNGDDVKVLAGITLDLKQHNINNIEMLYISGNLIDSVPVPDSFSGDADLNAETAYSTERGLICAEAVVIPSKTQTFAPIYDSARSGYVFVKLNIPDPSENKSQMKMSGNALTYNFRWTYSRDYAFTLLDADSNMSTHFKSSIVIGWTGEDSSVTKIFDFNPSFEKKVVSGSINEAGLNHGATVNNVGDTATLQAKFSFCDDLGSTIFTIYSAVYETTDGGETWSQQSN